MTRRNSFSTPGIAAIESLEPKQLLSGTTIDTASVSAEVQSALEQPAMRPKIVYDGVTDAEQFWGEGSRGESAINDQRQLASAAEFVPTEEDPLSIRMQFSIQGKVGVVIATRTEGASNGNAEKEYERGLVFTVEYNGMSVYQYDPAGGAYVIRYVQFPSLENGAVYDLLIEDTGTQAHIRLERAGDVILDQTGAVNRQTGLGGIVVRKQNMNTAVRLDVPSLSIAHGQEPVPRDTEETPSAPQIVSGVTDELPATEVDDVFGNVSRLLQAWEEQRAEVQAKPSPILFSTEGKEAFWEGVEAGTNINLNNRQQLMSANEVLPTEEDPLSIRMQFSIQGKAGVVIATRTEGAANQQVEKEFERGLVFTVEYNGMSVYQYDPAGGAYVIRYVQFPSLENGAVYDLLIEDKGTQAHIRLERAGDVILDQTGAVNRQTGLGGIVVRKQNPGLEPTVNIPSLTIAHGNDAQAESANLATTPAATASAPSTVERGDAIMSNEAIIAALDAAESASEASGSDTAYVQYSSETKEEFWEGTAAGGNVSLNETQQILSRSAFIASPEHPTVVQMQFALETLPGGVYVVTRSDGLTYGSAANEYRAGVWFAVEYNGASIYLEDERGGEYVARYVSFPSLRAGENYTLIAEDRGTEAVLRIEHEGQKIAELKGTVPGDAFAGKIALRNEALQQGHRVGIASMAVSGEEAAWTAPTYTAPVQPGDPRLAALTHFDYDAVMGGMERARVFEQSAFVVRYPSAVIARHPLYKQGNAGVDGDIEADFRIQMGAYTDVVGDALLRGMEVRIAELQGVSTANAMAMLDFAMGRSSGRYIGEFSSDFGVAFPSKEAILAESNRLLSSNIDRLIENQAAALEQKLKQNWIDTHEGDTGPSQHVRTPEEEAALQARLREIMVYTATVIGNYSSDVRAEFASAVTNAGFSVQEIYAEAGVADTTLVASADGTVLGQSSEVHVDLGSFTPSRITAWYRTELPTFGIRTDSAAGQALIGIIDRLHPAMETQELADIARSIEYFTAIPWWKIAQAAQSANGDSDVLAGNMLGLFHDAGFTHLLEPSIATTPQFLSTHQHKTEYLGEDMLVRFDLASAGKQIDHTFAYLLGHNGQIGDALPVQIDGLFARIPASVIDERIGDVESAHLQVKLVTWFAGQGDEGRITTTTEGVMWSKRETSTDELPTDTEMRQYIEEWDALTEAQRQTIRQAFVFDFGDLPENNKNEQLIQWLQNTFVNAESGEEHLMIWNAEKNAWVGSAYDNTQNAYNGECKYWIQQNVVSPALGVTLPSNDSTNDVVEQDAKWDPSEVVDLIIESTEGVELDAQNLQGIIQSGDIIQYVNPTYGQHTIIIGAITSEGIWSFDSNYFDQSPAYHFQKWSELSEAEKFSVYRIN